MIILICGISIRVLFLKLNSGSRLIDMIMKKWQIILSV